MSGAGTAADSIGLVFRKYVLNAPKPPLAIPTHFADLRGSRAVQLEEDVTCCLSVVAEVAFESDRRCACGFRIGDLRDQQAPSHMQTHEEHVAGGGGQELRSRHGS